MASQNGYIQVGQVRIPCLLGRGGMTYLKREGDGKSPVGMWRTTQLFARLDQHPKIRTALNVISIHSNTGWCDDPAHGSYNRPIKLPAACSHETLTRDDQAYDMLVVLDFNIRPRRRGGGSAIFLHVTAKNACFTAGCVAISARYLRWVAERLGPQTRLVIGPVVRPVHARQIKHSRRAHG